MLASKIAMLFGRRKQKPILLLEDDCYATSNTNMSGTAPNVYDSVDGNWTDAGYGSQTIIRQSTGRASCNTNSTSEGIYISTNTTSGGAQKGNVLIRAEIRFESDSTSSIMRIFARVSNTALNGFGAPLYQAFVNWYISPPADSIVQQIGGVGGIGQSESTTVTLNADTNYYFEGYVYGDQMKFRISTDGETWTTSSAMTLLTQEDPVADAGAVSFWLWRGTSTADRAYMSNFAVWEIFEEPF